MNDYELMVIFDPRIAGDEVPQAVEQVSGYVSAHGGEAEAPAIEEPWGRRRLAFPINDQTEGIYAVYNVKLDPAQTGNLDRDLKLNEQVMRFMLVRTDR